MQLVCVRHLVPDDSRDELLPDEVYNNVVRDDMVYNHNNMDDNNVDDSNNTDDANNYMNTNMDTNNRSSHNNNEYVHTDNIL